MTAHPETILVVGGFGSGTGPAAAVVDKNGVPVHFKSLWNH
jgi:hypothetical protein